LRDLYLEDNVSKRPITTKVDPHALTDYFESVAYIAILFLKKQDFLEKNDTEYYQTQNIKMQPNFMGKET